MGERVRVVRHDGGLLAAKDAAGRTAATVRDEARVLLAVQGPGVVELVGVSDGEASALLTRWVGSRSLAEVPVPMAPERAAALCLAVAATIGRLHRAGVVHGALDPTHVLLDPHGRPVLCGFGSAGPIGASVRRPATDPARVPDGEGPPGEATTLRPALDVAGLGRLLDHLLGPATSSGPALTWRRSVRRSAARCRALRALADHAQATDPTARPSVASFARSVRRAVPEARLGDEPDQPVPPLAPSVPTSRPEATIVGRRGPAGRHARPDAGPGRALHRSRLPAALAVVAVAAATYFGLTAWWSPSTPRRADASPIAPRTASAPTTSPAPMTGAPAPVVEHEGRRFEVGTAGDVVLVGPWLCDGRELPVVLHPADGTIHLFERWAGEGASVPARPVAEVAGATGLERADAGPGCAELQITVADGTISRLPTEDLR